MVHHNGAGNDVVNLGWIEILPAREVKDRGILRGQLLGRLGRNGLKNPGGCYQGKRNYENGDDRQGG
jgi:hypothetical protein